jgi:signal transduction histidine kinase
LRFDDSLETVLSAEMSTAFGAQSTWRQLVDLIGRGRASASDDAIARLRMIRGDVPPPVRSASARGLAAANPPLALVALFAEDDLSVAGPVLRTAQLSIAEWTSLLPALSPPARSILRHRRDLPRAVHRALESFGSVDFVLNAPLITAPEPVMQAIDASAGEAADSGVTMPDPVVAEPVAPEPVVAHPVEDEAVAVDWTEVVGEQVAEFRVFDAPLAETVPTPEAVAPVQVAPDASEDAPESATVESIVAEGPAPIAPVSSFVSIAAVAAGLPVVAEALRQAEREPTPADSTAVAPPIAFIRPPAPPATSETGPFQIAELVARIDAYQRQREETAPPVPRLEIQPELFATEPHQSESFRFETDANGIVRWIEGAARAPLIGLSFDLSPAASGARVDGVVAGAFRRRAGFSNARLVVDGQSDAAGQWRITGIPVFDRVSGRFTGYRGTARRPRADETAEPMRETRNPAADALRQLVHELRTPTNAIAGFAEMIESQMLGPVPAAYRAHAAAIRTQSGGLLTAIDDIDMAARIETHALDLRLGDVPVAPLLARILADLAPLATLRGTVLDRYIGDDSLAILGDDRAVERLVARLMATLVASGSAGERIGVAATREDAAISIVFDRPRALAAYAEESLLTIDAEAEAEREGAPLLGTGFALRLARNLAAELRGSLTIGDKALTLRLPAASLAGMEQVSSN